MNKTVFVMLETFTDRALLAAVLVVAAVVVAIVYIQRSECGKGGGTTRRSNKWRLGTTPHQCPQTFTPSAKWKPLVRSFVLFRRTQTLPDVMPTELRVSEEGLGREISSTMNHHNDITRAPTLDFSQVN